MIKRVHLVALVLVGLMACAPRVVPTERGIGFGDNRANTLRDAQLSTPRDSIVPAPRVTGLPSPAQPVVPGQTLSGPSNAIAANELAQAGIGQTAAPAAPANLGPDPFRTQGLDASPSNPAPELAGSAGLSDEQNFDAVSGRETIESDAERRAAQAAARQQVAPTAVPDRPSNIGPNIVEFALNAPNVKGQEWYSRLLLSGEGRFRRNCADYATPDDAQRDFLARGGPERDRRGIDPDGDGFACGWDPAPFIAAFRN